MSATFLKMALPRIEGVEFASMSLYRKGKDKLVPIDRPVFCLIGANGLGKSTFLNAVVYALTGVVPDPGRGFQSAREYLEEAGRPQRTSDYFGGRLSEADRRIATVTATLAWPTGRVTVKRRLAHAPGIAIVEVDEGGESRSYEGDDASAAFTAAIMKHTGFSDFAQFVFVVHFIMTFDEARHLLMWDERVLTNALYIAFGTGGDDVALASAKTRQMESEASLTRNVKFAAKLVNDRKGQLVDLLANNPVATPGAIELEARHDRLVDALAVTERETHERDTELRRTEVDLADAASRATDLQLEYRRLFNAVLAGSANAMHHPIIEETLRSGSCGVCSAPRADERIRPRVEAHRCPLCDAPLSPQTPGRGEEDLREVDRQLMAERSNIDEHGQRRQRQKVEHAAAVAAETDARLALETFNAANDLAGRVNDPRDSATIASEIARLDMERDSLVERSEGHRKRRDELRQELRELDRNLQERFEQASLSFVPRFRELAEAFIGLPIDIELEQRKGAEIAGFALVMEMDGKVRLKADKLSESQRFFLDIALRMALAEFISPGGSTMLIDTPEGSLDIAYEARAGNMFDDYARNGNAIVMTANLRSSKLIERLAERAGRNRMQIAKMTEWTDLSDVQRAEEPLFEEAYAAIEASMA